MQKRVLNGSASECAPPPAFYKGRWSLLRLMSCPGPVLVGRRSARESACVRADQVSGVEARPAVLVVGDPHRRAARAAPRAVLPADQYCRPRLQPLGAGAGGAVAFGEQAFAGAVP
jgi:hypothetical protein